MRASRYASATTCAAPSGRSRQPNPARAGGGPARVLFDVPGRLRNGLGQPAMPDAAAKARTAPLGVLPAEIAEHGAVSEAVVKAMALGALERTAADVVVAVSGIAGPDGGTPGKAGRHGVAGVGLAPRQVGARAGTAQAVQGRPGIGAPQGGRRGADRSARAVSARPAPQPLGATHRLFFALWPGRQDQAETRCPLIRGRRPRPASRLRSD